VELRARLYANAAFPRLLGDSGNLVGTDSIPGNQPEDRNRMRDPFRQNTVEGSGLLRVVVSSDMIVRRRIKEETLTRLIQETELRIEARTAQLSAVKRQLEDTVAELQAAHGELRAREDARRALEHGSELHELKLRFVSMTNHEFRTPLTTIHTAAELLRIYDGRFSGTERMEILDDILSAVGRMTVMLDQALRCRPPEVPA
jgi:signal transduction histidine kinase